MAVNITTKRINNRRRHCKASNVIRNTGRVRVKKSGVFFFRYARAHVSMPTMWFLQFPGKIPLPNGFYEFFDSANVINVLKSIYDRNSIERRTCFDLLCQTRRHFTLVLFLPCKPIELCFFRLCVRVHFIYILILFSPDGSLSSRE